MKRLLVLLAVLVPMSWCVAGCGGAGSHPAPGKQPSMQEQAKMLSERDKGAMKGPASAPAEAKK